MRSKLVLLLALRVETLPEVRALAVQTLAIPIPVAQAVALPARQALGAKAPAEQALGAKAPAVKVPGVALGAL